jgi:caffeoyl-CoA O-methyltransferase
MPITIVNEHIEAYAAAHTSPLPPLLSELEEQARAAFGPQAGMLSGHIVGGLLQTLIRAMGARNVLEIGMFAGLSALMMAETLPDRGSLVTCEVDPKAIASAKSYFARSPHGSKIEVREGPALDTIRSLTGPIDLVFIDADKGNYINYYESVLPLLSPQGVIVADNVLWSGNVLEPERPDDHAIVAFNAHVHADTRVRATLLTVRDGLLLITRAY